MLSNGFWSRMPRYPDAGWIAGVCAGLAAYYDINVRVLRAIVVVAAIFSHGAVVIAYAVLWYLMEREPGVPPGLTLRRRERSRHRDRSDRAERYERSAAAADADSPTPTGPTSAELRSRFARMEARLRDMETCVTSSEYELRQEFRKLGG